LGKKANWLNARNGRGMRAGQKEGDDRYPGKKERKEKRRKSNLRIVRFTPRLGKGVVKIASGGGTESNYHLREHI